MTVWDQPSNEARGVRGPPSAADLTGGGRIPGPADRLQDLGPEPQQRQGLVARQAHGQQAAGVDAPGLGLGQKGGQGVGGDGAQARLLAQPVRQASHGLLRRGVAETGDAVAAHDGQAVGPDQLGQLPRMFGQGGVQIAFGGQAQDQFVLQPAQADPVAIQFGVGLGLQLTGQGAGQGGAGDPQFIGQQQRRGAVAGDQAPQDVVDDDRHRGRGPHAHVLQILDMDRRDRAQAAVAHVQRRLARRDRPQGLGRIAAVGDDPHRIAQIQGAGLAGDVGRREMVVQEGRRAGRARFRDHLARLVVEETVDHDPFAKA